MVLCRCAQRFLRMKRVVRMLQHTQLTPLSINNAPRCMLPIPSFSRYWSRNHVCA